MGESAEESGLEQTKSPKVYHERQSRQLCALHALNNLFQKPNTFKKLELDQICSELSPDSKIFNPHRSVLGLGSYDVNVIISALSKRDYEVVWFDKRKEFACINLDLVFGLILNIPNSSFSYIPKQAQIWSSHKHWITIRKIGWQYYDLDSKLISPICIGDKDDLLQYLTMKNLSEIEILLVVHKSKSKDEIFS